MTGYIKWMGILALAFLMVVGVFVQFGQYLLDYSLESLGYAVEATDKHVEETTALERGVYRKIVSDMILEEMASENVDYENLMLLETAARSLEEPVELAGFLRAREYINAAMAKKTNSEDRKDRINYIYYQVYYKVKNFVSSVIDYVMSKIQPPRVESFQISDELLISQAQLKEQQGKLAEARELYETYLNNFKNRSDRGLVGITLAHIMMQQQDWDDAEELLLKIQKDFDGQREGNLAASFLKRIQLARNRSSDISRFQTELNTATTLSAERRAHFKLGVAYVSLGEYDNATDHLLSAVEIEDDEIRQRAVFYLGLVYKLQNDLENAAEILSKLASEEQLQFEMRLALEAELAEIYLQAGELEKAKQHYKNLSKHVSEVEKDRLGAMKTWISISQVEQAMVYVQTGDFEEAKMILNGFGDAGVDAETMIALTQKLAIAKEKDLRAEAFRLLFNKQVTDSIKLFEKIVQQNRDDAWSFSGLATGYLMLRDIENAHDLAEHAYELQQDEYTSAALAYVLGFMGETKDAIWLYQTSLSFFEDYAVAQFNLSCEYIKYGDFAKAKKWLDKLESRYLHSTDSLMRAQIYNNLGMVAWGQKQQAESLNYFRSALKINPQYLKAEANIKLIEAGKAPILAVQEMGLAVTDLVQK